jgi:4-hydroxy-2-oxoheptanedioate aldolase
MSQHAESDQPWDLGRARGGSVKSGSHLPNRFKLGLRAHQIQIGLWSSLCSHIVAEVIAGAGFDWIVIDGEHAPNELNDIVHQLQAMSSYPVEPVVRIPFGDTVIIKRFLDAGARSLLVPMVQDEPAATNIVAATRYPPAGIRGVSVAHRANQFGRIEEYMKRATENLCIVVQIETAEAVSNVEAIASVDGIDGLFIGPSDLAADLGHLGEPDHPNVQAAIMSAIKRCKGAGKPMGILTPNFGDANRYLELGFAFVAVGSDVGILARQSERLAASFERWKRGR